MAANLPNTSVPMDTGDDWKNVKPEESHLNDVADHIPVNVYPYFTALKMKKNTIDKEMQGTDTALDIQQASFNIFYEWLEFKASGATLQAVIDGIGKCGFNDSQLSFLKEWTETGRKGEEQIKEGDFYPIIRAFTPNQLRKLFSKGLEIEPVKIATHMELAADPQQKMLRLLRAWRQANIGTLGQLLDAFKGVNNGAIEALSGKWREHNQQN